MNDELHRITALVEDSRLWRLVRRPLTAAPAAWHSSLIGRTCHGWAARLSSWQRSERIRILAVTIGSAAAIHIAIVQFLPLYARPAIPMRWWGLVIGVAMLVAVFAEAVTAAWPRSRFAKVARAASVLTGWFAE